jgi:O-antigen/teichoic acid export membrane protein
MVDGVIRGFLAEALFPLTGLITAAFLTRRLGPEGYGLLTLAAALVAWLEWTVGSLFSRATIKLVGEAEDWRPVGATLVRLHLIWGCSAALLLWLVASPIAVLFDEPALAGYLGLFALEIPISNLARVHTNILVGIGSFRARALARAGRWIARLVIIVVLVELGFSVPGAILGSIGASLVELAIGRLCVRPSLSSGSPFPARRLWAEAVPLFLFALSLTLHGKLDLLALKMLGGTSAQAGLYGAAQNLSVVPGIFAVSFSPLLLSTLSRALRGGDSTAAREAGCAAMRTVFVLLPFVGMIVGAAPEIVGLIFGESFLPAAPLLSWLIVGGLAHVMISVAAVILIAAGKPRWPFALAGPLVPLAIAGHIVLIPRLGATGASLVTATSASIGALVAVIAVHRVWRIHPPLMSVGRSILVLGVAYIFATLWAAPGLLLLVKLPVITIAICVSFLLLREFSAGEIELARSLAHGKSSA